MRKYAYIIPGFMENANTRKTYKQIASLFRKKGYTPVIAKITWKQRVMSDYVKEFNSQLKEDVSKSVFLGFSFGAIIAFVSAVEHNPKKLLLCSLSPYFKQDIERTKNWKHFKAKGFKRRIKDLRNFDFDKLSKKSRTETILFVGGKEIEKYPPLGFRAKDAHRKIRGSKLTLIKDAPHDIGHVNYFSKIKESIEKC